MKRLMIGILAVACGGPPFTSGLVAEGDGGGPGRTEGTGGQWVGDGGKGTGGFPGAGGGAAGGTGGAGGIDGAGTSGNLQGGATSGGTASGGATPGGTGGSAGKATGGAATGGQGSGGVGGKASGGTIGTGGSAGKASGGTAGSGTTPVDCSVTKPWQKGTVYYAGDATMNKVKAAYIKFVCGPVNSQCGNREPGVDKDWQSSWTEIGTCGG
jgi:hypothetical protein